jgi:hypothetical protein
MAMKRYDEGGFTPGPPTPHNFTTEDEGCTGRSALNGVIFCQQDSDIGYKGRCAPDERCGNIREEGRSNKKVLNSTNPSRWVRE